MAKVITFSRYFPPYHPRKGQPTYFIEKLNKSLGFEYGIPFGDLTEKHFAEKGVEYSHQVFSECLPKHHTIREGNRWKVGDKFSPRVWSGKPYYSKQIIIAPDVEIKKIWDVVIEFTPSQTHIMLPTAKHSEFQLLSLGDVAKNDGLSFSDFEGWFNPQKKHKTFSGKIICWNEKINY